MRKKSTRVGGRQQLADTTKRPGGREIFSSFLLKRNGHFQSFPQKQTVLTSRCLEECRVPPRARLRLLPDAGQVVGLGEDAHLELGIKDFVNRVLINVPSTLIIDSLLLTWMYLERS